MLAIHWSPLKNTRRILRHGIYRSKAGVFCSLLTGQPAMDSWWCRALQQWHAPGAYRGFIFRVTRQDLPASFGHWLHGAKEKPLTSLAQIQATFDNAIYFRIGERHFGYSLEADLEHGDEYERVGREMVARQPQLYRNILRGDDAFLQYIFEDYQLVLSHSIAPKRIVRVIESVRKGHAQNDNSRHHEIPARLAISLREHRRLRPNHRDRKCAVQVLARHC